MCNLTNPAGPAGERERLRLAQAYCDLHDAYHAGFHEPKLAQQSTGAEGTQTEAIA